MTTRKGRPNRSKGQSRRTIARELTPAQMPLYPAGCCRECGVRLGAVDLPVGLCLSCQFPVHTSHQYPRRPAAGRAGVGRERT